MKNLILSTVFALVSLASYSQTAPQPAKTRCAGITAKGVQCLNMGKPTHCHLHADNAVKCTGITAKGLPCKSPVKKGETACYRHKA